MSTTNPDIDPLLEESIEITAPPERVWQLVTDLPRMASWSPEVAKTIVRGGGPVGLGTTTININRRGLRVWPTRSKVIRFEPHTEFAFRIKDNKAIWSYSLAPTAAGTKLTQRREMPDGMAGLAQGLQKVAFGGIGKYQDQARVGMRETLERLKTDAEA
ncbi:SRPBCC family protein [Nocardioides speluncae]|uniref:SRPBCC family protein n=1 Tax=Nocardioides speluncae TaxID=2670337 RepID=UPI000D698909|nr:SRPBCC family protein [Nocardioides speluncae]